MLGASDSEGHVYSPPSTRVLVVQEVNVARQNRPSRQHRRRSPALGKKRELKRMREEQLWEAFRIPVGTSVVVDVQVVNVEDEEDGDGAPAA